MDESDQRAGAAADVVVIGAGVAGLAAAGDLAAAGLRATVLEARERIGGRVLTVHDAESPVAIELGAEFVHGRAPAIWELLDALDDATVVQMSGEWWTAGERGLCPREDLEPSLEEIFERMDAERSPDRSFADYLAASFPGETWRARRDSALQYVRGFHAARPERISERALAHGAAREEQIEGYHAFRLPGGYDAVVASLARRARGDVRLGHVVTHVRWDAGGVEVRARSTRGDELPPLRARRALVTLPLGVLKAPDGAEGAVRFDPPLEAKRVAMTGLEVGAAARVVLRFRGAPWEDRSLVHLASGAGGGDLSRLSFLFSAGDERLPVWWTSFPVASPLIVGWAGGPGAERLAGMDGAAMGRLGVEVLARLLGAECEALASRLAASYFHDWWSDPFARGAYSYVAVGGVDAPRLLGEAVAGTLFFAGEATDTAGDTGTVHGAIATGRRAAAEVVAAARGD